MAGTRRRTTTKRTTTRVTTRATKQASKQATKRSGARTGAAADDDLALLPPTEAARARTSEQHVYGKKIKCVTDTRGFATPGNDARVRIVVDASEGFIPLWAKNCTLRWRFQEQSIRRFRNPEQAKARVRTLLGKALLAWGDAVPIKFAERRDAWDFEVAVRNADDCDISGCTLASAFFPDSGRHELTIYPMMLGQSEKEQVETLAHEFGHVFGLRHFFAKISEREWASEIFGTHKPFSIMNYGAKSLMTDADRNDLRTLYQKVWSGQLTAINGTRIKLVKPAHYD
ncbi:MAG: matrix metalloproteinase-11 [Gemmatimonadetes bacterium]|nr:matrix metalloproteinase-11 [Gemmatimonadota bacterium]